MPTGTSSQIKVTADRFEPVEDLVKATADRFEPVEDEPIKATSERLDAIESGAHHTPASFDTRRRKIALEGKEQAQEGARDVVSAKGKSPYGTIGKRLFGGLKVVGGASDAVFAPVIAGVGEAAATAAESGDADLETVGKARESWQNVARFAVPAGPPLAKGASVVSKFSRVKPAAEVVSEAAPVAARVERRAIPRLDVEKESRLTEAMNLARQRGAPEGELAALRGAATKNLDEKAEFSEAVAKIHREAAPIPGLKTNVTNKPPDPNLTSARAADITDDRTLMGLDMPDQPGTRRWRDVLAQANQEGIPDRAMRIAEEVGTKPRALSDVETAGVVVHATKLKREHAAIMERVAAAADPADVKLASAEATRIEQEFDQLSRALKSSGTEKGRALAAQRLTINQDYQLVSVLQRAKAAKGSDLTLSERKKIEKLVLNLDETKRHVATDPKQIEHLDFVQDQAQIRIRENIEGLKPRTIWGTTGEAFNAARSIMTAIDFPVLRQGAIISLAHPVRASKSLPTMFKSFASEEALYRSSKEIASRANAPLYARSRLYLAPTDTSARLSSQEEAFMSRMAKKIPLVRHSERAYVGFLNKLRADSFDAMSRSLAKNGEVTQPEAEAISNFINIATGRGDLWKFEKAAQGLNTFFFAPRYVTSRFQFLAGQPLHGGTDATRKLIAKEYGRYLVGVGVVYSLGRASGADVEVDPRSSDFGKMRFGNTRIDVGSGLAQVSTFVSRILSGKTKTLQGKLVPIRGEKTGYGNDAFDVMSRFGRSKLSPSIGAGIDVATGKDVVGRPVTGLSAIGKLAYPIIADDVIKTIKEHGVPEGVAMSLIGLFGAGLQTYDKKQPESKFKKHEPEPELIPDLAQVQ